MTRLRGASLDSPDSAQHGGEKHQACRSKVPTNAPEVIKQNTIEVANPSRVLPWYRDERRRRFNVLVRKYKNQLVHGCDDPGCRTPTCASRRRRMSEGPYRRFTELSARTLACYLSSLDDAESGLCPNTPKPSSELTIRDYHTISLQRSRAFQAAAVVASEQTNSTATQSDNHDHRSKHNGEGPRKSGSGHRAQAADPVSSTDGDPTECGFPDIDHAAEQPLKDPKSFTQNLFDTLSLRMVEWLPLRRESESAQSKPMRPTGNLENQPQATEKPRSQKTGVDKPKTAQGHADTSQPSAHPPRTPSSRTTGTQSSAVELKIPNQHVKRLSITEVDHWRQSPRSSLEEKRRPDYKNTKLTINSHLAPNELSSLTSPPALKHRPQKHRGRIEGADNLRPVERSKPQRRVSWDSEKVINQASLASPGNPRSRPTQSAVDIDSPSYRKAKHETPPRKQEFFPLAQTLTHFTPEIINALGQIMIETEEEAEMWREELDRLQSMGGFDNPDWRFATLRQRQVFPFVAQSTFFILSSAKHILHSFRRDVLISKSSDQGLTNSCLDIASLRGSLQHLFTICPWDIALHSVWSALDKLFVPPTEFPSSARTSRRSSRSSTMTGPAPPVVRRMSESAADQHLSDADAAHIATVAFFVLVSAIPDLSMSTWRGILRMRAAGTIASSADMQKLPVEHAQQAVEATDKLEHELGLRLVNRLVRALTARLAYHEISKARQAYSLDLPKQRRISVLDRIVDHLSEHHSLGNSGVQASSSDYAGPALLIVEWLRTLFLREWDGNPEMSRSSAAGGAIQILALMYKERNRLGLCPEDFRTPFLADRLDPVEMPVAWLGSLSNNRTMHLLSYSFLFPPSFLVIYFRSLNYSAMSKYFEAALTTTRHVTQTAFGSIRLPDDGTLLSRMKVSMSTYFVLVVRRDNILTDALDQLWRREKRELMRPLKVQMGMDEGEEGLDHGGVQQEFFRVLMAEALDPAFGMFTMDSRHRLSWFQPCSLEPLYKFELLGLLMSIAIYNGLTLPVNFPVAFYRKLLGLKVKHLDHLRDGWPELTQGLETLLSWEDGDVGDIFMRTYEFSFESVGRIETVDMQRVDRDAAWPVPARTSAPSSATDAKAWSTLPHLFDPAIASPPSSSVAESVSVPSISGGTITSKPTSLEFQSPTPPADEASLVTNENRHQFVKDYIFWLTDKSIRPQFEAFLRGFYTCLDRSALSIFTPESLKSVVEGLQEIDIQELEDHARYEGGFGPDHRVIQDFWSVVKEYSPEKKAHLLEFVTASDRVPVNGISSIMFMIQKNGVGDLRLPTSLTCFGRLLLPEYSSRAALAQKLDKALENAQGFGTA
ncbi:hypothetical protein N7532_008533 [Penicillium argentinense]|uniref:HECT-type E3 ubiquitin transferase n=1 Tax=Penicillium argentinense TaxID=1131581 RepID=A0A9W9K1Q0_9EURO|nr:uncharacterized protein N7532_008533 [Penicillium argentinense]KAJ5089849.1 hypothetical protein N7532_008533 [Penicillium argentinense]